MVVGATRQSRFLFYVWQILLTAALQGPIKPDPGSQLGGDPWPEWSRSAESLASSEIEQECRQSVDSFLRRAESSLQSPLGSRHPNPRDMLFFLHVPRTAGRTFFACFLKQATPPSKRCAKSYDILRLNVSVEGCGLLSSHDDYSVTAVLPPTATVITQIRDPVDRVLSAYEFAVEVASRHLQVPLGVRTPRPPGKPRVDTRNVWPWSLLVPWMEADMRMRAAKLRSARDGALKENNTSRREFVRLRGHAGGRAYYHSLASGASKEELSQGDVLLPNLDPYNNPLAMPLREFIEHPIVASTIHNGAALQVLGLTNYSHHRDAAKLRGCVAEVPSVREAMVRVAVQRLQGMYHVGVTDRLQESITSAAGSLGINLTGPAWRGKADAAFEYGDESVAEAEAPTRSDGPYSQLMHLQNQTDAILEELSRKQKELEQLRQSSYNSGSANAALDSHAHTLEREVGRLRSEAANLQMLSMRSRTTPPKMHTRAARLVRQDNEFVQAHDLTTAFWRCTAASREKNQQRWKALSLNKMPDGRFFSFTAEARDLIRDDILQRIRALNSMDVTLYETARTLLEESQRRLQAEGALQELRNMSDSLSGIEVASPSPSDVP